MAGRIDLNRIGDFIAENTRVVAMATDLEVIICDRDGNVLGDSNLEQVDSKDALSEHSIVRKCIQERKPILLKDNKRENPACAECVNSSQCNINSIVAFPIMDNGQLIGGIGLFSFDTFGKELLNKKYDQLARFIEHLSGLLVSKVRETFAKRELQTVSERTRLLVESLDEAVINIDNDGRIIYKNAMFRSLFCGGKTAVDHLDDLYGILSDSKLPDFMRQCLETKTADKMVVSYKRVDYILQFKPVVVEKEYAGGLLLFRNSSDIYKSVKTLKDNDYNVEFSDIIGESAAIMKAKKSAVHFAKGPSNIFIMGKSGTGKEIFARAIHNASMCAKGPFVAINCAAIPENLLESELFGHKEGAFTGSMKGGQVGKFELADKGTLFLDEIGEMPLHLQPKLLRAIQEKRIQPVGSNEYKKVDIRIISATNRNLEKMVEEGTFREDLYYRLSVIPLYIPPLKERPSDIPLLLDFFLEKFNLMLGKNILGWDSRAKEILCGYEWPGNIRELQNAVEYAANDCGGQYIQPENLPQKVIKQLEDGHGMELKPLKEIEELYIRQAFGVYGNTPEGKDEAAKALGISRSTYYRRLAEMGLK